MTKYLAVLLASGLLNACDSGGGGGGGGGGGAGGSEEPDGGGADELALDFASGVAADGEGVYELVCTSCHGADGHGLTTDLPATSGNDLAEEVPEFTDGRLAAIVRNGYKNMAAQTQITDDQMVDLIAYLRVTFGAHEGE